MSVLEISVVHEARWRQRAGSPPKRGEVEFNGRLRDVHTSFSVRFDTTCSRTFSKLRSFDILRSSVFVPWSGMGSGGGVRLPTTAFVLIDPSPRDTAVYILVALGPATRHDACNRSQVP